MREVIVAAAKEFFSPLVTAFVWLSCQVGNHDWTNASAQGKKPTPEQLENGVEGFWDYARVYCAKCGKTSEIYRDAVAKKERG